MTVYDENDDEALTALLVGHKVTKVADDKLMLDDGTELTLAGNEGGCSCGAGDYELRELNGVDNIITKVELVCEPDADGRMAMGFYEIFVYADNQLINLARFEGSDGNGFTVRVQRPTLTPDRSTS
jgi:hypothetical protein